MDSMIDLSSKTVLITGASSGIGAATALLCSRLGAKTVLVARREKETNDVMQQLAGTGHSAFLFDLSNIAEIDGLVEAIVSQVGPIGGFVHCAGAAQRTLPLRVLKPAVLQSSMDLYLNAFVEMTRCITKRGHFAAGLSIVGISSVFSMIGAAARTDYCVSKAAVNAAVRCFARELAPQSVRANAVCPGMIDTARLSKYNDISGQNEAAKKFAERQYLGIGEPTDIANVIAFLLSDASRLITGQSIVVDGGLLSS